MVQDRQDAAVWNETIFNGWMEVKKQIALEMMPGLIEQSQEHETSQLGQICVRDLQQAVSQKISQIGPIPQSK